MAARNEAAPAVAEATLRYYRCSAQKARLVVDQIRGKNVNQALGLLRFSPKAASAAIEKLLRSAVANAERGAERVDADTLYLSEAYVGPGPSLKRFRGRAFGRAFRVLHRTCHVTLKLSAKAAAAAGKPPAAAGPSGKGRKRAAPRKARAGGGRRTKSGR